VPNGVEADARADELVAGQLGNAEGEDVGRGREGGREGGRTWSCENQGMRFLWGRGADDSHLCG